jgi:hypothetical protein
MTTPFAAGMPQPAPISSAAEGEKLIAHIVETMDALIDILQQETDLVRAGRLAKAAACQTPKGDLTRLYIADALRLRSNHPQLSRLLPAGRLEELRRRHDTFRTLLQLNLTVLATAHAVSEGILRGVSGELAKKSVPQTYGMTGRANVPSRRPATPLAISRML